MGALFKQPKQVQQAEKTVTQTVPAPEPTAGQEDTAGNIGNGRREEDKALFGGSQPDLRVDRPNVPASVGTAGSGLKLM